MWTGSFLFYLWGYCSYSLVSVLTLKLTVTQNTMKKLSSTVSAQKLQYHLYLCAVQHFHIQTISLHEWNLQRFTEKNIPFLKKTCFHDLLFFFQQLSVFLVYPVKAGGRLHVWKSSFRSLNSEPEWQAVYIYIDEYHCVYKAVNFLQQHGTSYRANGRHPSWRLIAVGVPSTVTVMSCI